jgi:hypothetical protein
MWNSLDFDLFREISNKNLKYEKREVLKIWARQKMA